MNWLGRETKQEKPQPVIDEAGLAHLEQILKDLQEATREMKQARAALEKSYEKIRRLSDQRGRSGGRG